MSGQKRTKNSLLAFRMAARAPGYYWVCEGWGAYWLIAEWDGTTWHLPGADDEFDDNDFREIDESPIIRTAKRTASLAPRAAPDRHSPDKRQHPAKRG